MRSWMHFVPWANVDSFPLPSKRRSQLAKFVTQFFVIFQQQKLFFRKLNKLCNHLRYFYTFFLKINGYFYLFLSIAF